MFSAIAAAALLSTSSVGVSLAAFALDFATEWRVAKWPAGPITYRFNDTFPRRHEAAVHNALMHMAGETCLRFVYEPHMAARRVDLSFEYTPESTTCGAMVGMRTGNVMWGSDRCYNKMGYVLHEVLHNLGFMHEHQRPDRDQYIHVHYDRVLPAMEHNYYPKTKPRWPVSTYGTEYDPYSVMHYEPTIFAKPGYTYTMETVQHDIDLDRVGQKQHLSDGDIAAIKMLYCDGDGNSAK